MLSSQWLRWGDGWVCAIFSLDDVKGEKVETYRDTMGIPAEDYAKS
ncbi:hypothetical protein [Nostoc sp. KVJ3]|nr:hypothetical protein [Nostoc sp. KVJ3]